MVRELFDSIRADRANKYDVSLQLVQIHVERIYDLLVEGDPKKGSAIELKLREDKTNGVYVQGASRETAASVDEAFGYLRSAAKRLAFASTNMNMRSSRSHAAKPQVPDW